MNYPTKDEVEQASHMQVCQWYRFLPSPGTSALGGNRSQFEARMAQERVVMDRIVERFNELGGMTTEISKAIGW